MLGILLFFFPAARDRRVPAAAHHSIPRMSAGPVSSGVGAGGLARARPGSSLDQGGAPHRARADALRPTPPPWCVAATRVANVTISTLSAGGTGHLREMGWGGRGVVGGGIARRGSGAPSGRSISPQTCRELAGRERAAVLISRSLWSSVYPGSSGGHPSPQALCTHAWLVGWLPDWPVGDRPDRSVENTGAPSLNVRVARSHDLSPPDDPDSHPPPSPSPPAPTAILSARAALLHVRCPRPAIRGRGWSWRPARASRLRDGE